MDTQPITHQPRVAPTSPLAVASLIFGIVCWLALPLVGSIVAIVCGHLARRDIRESRGELAGDGLAVGGMVLGYLHLATIVFAIVLAIAFFGGIAALLAVIGLSAA